MIVHLESITMNTNTSADSKESKNINKPKPSRAKNLMEKVIGLSGLGILGYVAAVIAINIAITVAYIVFGLSYLNAIFRKDCFSDFRYHYDGLVSAPIKMRLYNGFVLPLFNTVIDIWNGFCNSTRGYEYHDNTNVSAFSFTLYLNILQNCMILIRNQFDISHFALEPYPDATYEEFFKMDEKKGEPNSIRMGYFFMKGSFEWARDLVISVKDSLVAFFSRQAVPSAQVKIVDPSAPPMAEAVLVDNKASVLSFSTPKPSKPHH